MLAWPCDAARSFALCYSASRAGLQLFRPRPVSCYTIYLMRLKAIVRLRCSHCLQGAVFHSVWGMNARCPVCGVVFEREEGYFLMAIFIGYALGLAAVAPVCLLLYLYQATWPWYVAASGGVLLAFSPIIFRYARVVWLHLDELLDPRVEEDETDARG